MYVYNTFIGWRDIIPGILTPIFKFPFIVHQSKYKAKNANIPVDKNVTPEFSKPVNILLRKGDTGNPSGLTKTYKIIYKNHNNETTENIVPKINFPINTNGLWSTYFTSNLKIS